MGNLKISELPTATALQGTEVFALVQGGTTSNTTLNDIDNYLIATSLTVVDGQTVNLSDTTYASLGLLKLSYTATGGVENTTLNLPDATLNVNRLIRFLSDTTFNANTRVNITAINAQTIDGSTNAYVVNKAYEGIQVWSNGTEWFVIQKKA